MAQKNPTILWLRQDLRLADNPALHAAAQSPFFAVYIWDEKDPWAPGSASKWWLDKSLHCLKKSLEERGVQLVFRRGDPLQVLKNLVEETKASSVYWNRCYEPYSIKRDQEIKDHFVKSDIYCQSFRGSLLLEPWHIETKTGRPYQVFTPFWSALQQFDFPPPLPVPALEGWKPFVLSDSLEDWELCPTLWGDGLAETWNPGEKSAETQLLHFLEDGINGYANKRDFPAQIATSHLSPALHWGEISPIQVWQQALRSQGSAALPFLRQLAWREFSYHLLFHFPELPTKPLNSSFENFSWITETEQLEAWQKGKTGYPLVDAGMRELWHTGGMHNRVRMVTASFLVKHLLIPWQSGAAWFWDTLVDADLANNSMSWQWVAGCGADAAPYFRILNPILQSQRFDPDGVYIKKWVPELRGLDGRFIHCPWEASPDTLKNAGINMGETYPFPIIDHVVARQRALAALKAMSH